MRVNHQRRYTYFSVSCILCISLLIACTTPPSKQEAGTVGGAIAGGLIGSHFGRGNQQLLSTTAGTIVGILIGSAIGKYMDDYDRKMAAQTLDQQAVGVPAKWHNPTTDIDYTFTPTSNIESIDGRQCRKFTQQAIVDGKPENIEGTACKEPEGENWNFI